MIGDGATDLEVYYWIMLFKTSLLDWRSPLGGVEL
jgi:hypothetical protein